MRFKRQLPIVILLLSGFYILLLALQKDLDLYIHNRYILFTIIMSILGTATVIVSHLLNKAHAHNARLRPDMLPIFIILLCAIFLPARSLTSATVTQRTTTSSSLIGSSESTANLLTRSSRILTLRDWSRLLDANTNEDFYINKTATLSGFTYDAGLGDDTVWLARFVVTCCAVDAQPIGVPVYIPNWQDKYQQDEWLAVDGQFEKRQTAQGEQMVLVPKAVNKIDEPDNPYAN